MEGWDFSYLENKILEDKPPWDYARLARSLVKKSNSVLDMGTGGGEVFSSFAPFRKAAATEGYPPNYLLAKKRLGSLGVKVVKFSNSTTRNLPFKSGEFDLVLNRHDAFNVGEVFRILKSGGIFLTQQVAKDSFGDLMKFFGARPQFNVASFREVKKKMKVEGFNVAFAEEWKGRIEFADVGALVYFLKNCPWIVKDFSVVEHLKYLLKLQKRLEGGRKLVFGESSYLIHAEKS